MQCLAVGFAGFFGAIARLLIGMVCGRAFSQFPVGTLVINLSGSFILGWFSAFVGQRVGFSETLRMAIAVGFVGAYTTFSTFMYESDALMRQGAWLKASTNLIGSIVLGLLAVRLGAYMASK
jgi:CrcB protein